MNKEYCNEGTVDEYRAVYKDLEYICNMFSKLCGVSDAEYWILLTAREHPVTQHEICTSLSLNKQTINSACRQLAGKGYIRLETSPDNLRSKKIYLTESGLQYVEQHIDSVLALEETVWYRLSKEERVLLTGLTDKFNDMMEEELLAYRDKIKNKEF